MEKSSGFLMAVICFTFTMTAILSTGAPGILYADGCGDDPVRFEKYSRLGADAEKAGRTEEAFDIYHSVLHNVEICDDKKTAKAEENLARAGKKLGSASEARGALVTEDGVYKTVEDARCKPAGGESGMSVEREEAAGMLPGECAPGGGRHVLRKDAGAYDWFEESHNYGDADRVMVKYVKSAPEDMNIFRKGFDHLTGRKNLSARGYAPDPGNLAVLEKIATTNGEKALKNEDAEFKKAGAEADAFGLRVVQSVKYLTNARDWLDFFKSPSLKTVASRAENRGDALFPDNRNPKSLEEALEYYEFTGSADKIKKIREKAERLGDESAKLGDFNKAGRYYALSGNKEKMNQAEENLKKESEGKAKKQMQEMIKDKGKQKEFKKEEEQLEKELGL